jgi:hypothetical protein
MGAVLAWLGNLLTGGALNKAGDIAQQIIQAYADKQKAVGADAIAAAQAEIDRLTILASVQKADSWGWTTSLSRFLLELPFVLFLWKVIVWDKILQWGVTDPLGADLTSVFYGILAYLFVTSFRK